MNPVPPTLQVFGELALKALEFVQTGLPMAGLAVAGAQFRLAPDDRRLLWQARGGAGGAGEGGVVRECVCVWGAQ